MFFAGSSASPVSLAFNFLVGWRVADDFIVVVNVGERRPYAMPDQGAHYVGPVEIIQRQVIAMGMVMFVVEQILQYFL